MWRERVYGWLTGLGLLACAAGLVLYPQEAGGAAGGGLRLCLGVIVPALLPFFVVSGLTVELGLAARLGRFLEPVMRRLFNVSGPCAAAFLLGFIGGYPVGARTAIALYREGACTREEAATIPAPPSSWAWWGPASFPTIGLACCSTWRIPWPRCSRGSASASGSGARPPPVSRRRGGRSGRGPPSPEPSPAR